MKRMRFTDEQRMAALRDAENGMKVQEVLRKYGISEPTYYSWKAKYGGMEHGFRA